MLDGQGDLDTLGRLRLGTGTTEATTAPQFLSPHSLSLCYFSLALSLLVHWLTPHLLVVWRKVKGALAVLPRAQSSVSRQRLTP